MSLVGEVFTRGQDDFSGSFVPQEAQKRASAGLDAPNLMQKFPAEAEATARAGAADPSTGVSFQDQKSQEGTLLHIVRSEPVGVERRFPDFCPLS